MVKRSAFSMGLRAPLDFFIHYLAGLKLTLLLLFISLASFAQGVSLTFSNGYLGTQNSAVQSTSNIKNLSSIGISRVSFSQSYTGSFGGTQGNDLSGTIKLYLSSGSVITLSGALNWRETTGNNVEVFGLIFNPGQNASIAYGNNQIYNIVGGSTSGSSTSLGLRAYSSSFVFTDGESRSGNAATSGIIANFNTELTTSPQPSAISLTNTSVIEGQSLVYTVTLSSATTANRPQVYTFNTSGPATKGADYNATYTFNNGVVNNGDGTITVPGGVSSFTVTVSTIDDSIVESIENLLLTVGSKIGVGSIADNDNVTAANCDPNSLYDNIVSGYHQSIAKKSDGTFAVWGGLMANNGTGDRLSPTTINATNYPNLVGTPLKAAVAGEASSTKSQAVLLSTDGLYAWGAEGYLLDGGLTSSTTFAKIATPTGGDANTKLPTGVAPGSVKMMVAFYKALVIVTNSGNVWVLSTNSAGEIRGVGTSAAAATTWSKVKIDASTDLTNVISVRGMIDNDPLYNGLMALTADGKAYVWGKSVYLADGAGSVSKSYATQMVLPAEFNETNLPKMIAVTGGNKTSITTCKNTFYILSNGGNLYAVGDNQKRQIGDFTTTERKVWTRVKINATTDFTNINYISAMESDPSDPAVVAITKAGVLYTWGFNPRKMIGRPTADTSYDPGIPAGFTQGTDKAIFAEMGGHTLVYIKEGSTQFCYVGHRVDGSMGDGTNTDADEVAFNCSGTPSLAVCGSVPVAASTTTSTITANPTSIGANGITTSTITVQLKQANGTNLTSTGGTVVITTNKGTISDVIDNNDGTYTAILTSSSFVETATLNFTLNGANGTNNASVNFTLVTNPVLTATGTLKTFTSCSGCTVTPQSFTVSGVDLATNNLVVTAPTGFQVSTNPTSGFATSINIAPTSGTVTMTTVYAKLTNNATAVAAGVISVTSTSADAKTLTVTTNTDNALMLDGAGDYVNLGDVLDYSTVANTTEAWVYWKGSTEAYSEIFTKDAIQSFSITSGNKLHANFGDGSTWISGLNSTTSVPLNTWTHLAVTRSSTGVVKMYINGVLDASTNTMNVTGNNTALRSIGGKNVSGTMNGLFTGAIDNLTIWNVEKTASEISTGMYVELAGNETDLLAYYDFNQGIARGTNSSITSLLDKGPSAFNGTITGVTLTGSTSNFVDGYIPPIKTFVNANVNNNALSFGGANDYVQSNLDGTTLTSFTIEAFINPANTTGTKGILQWAPNNDPTSGIPMILIQQYTGTGIAVFVNGSYGLNATIPANSWSHFAVVYANSLYTLYVNGISVATYSGGNQYQANSAKLYLGTGYPQPWNGLLDEVRVWNKARSASEIFNNMYNDLSGTESGLMAYYNMNQGNANASNSGTLTDKTSNANNGTFTGFALNGSSSNYILGNTQIGESVKFSKGTTYQLANALSGGTWFSSNTAVATVNASSGLVTGVATGAASITYTICNKTVSYPIEIYTPTITVNSSSLKTFVNCSGCGTTPQSFTISGSNLVANLVVTAPAGFEVSTASYGTYSSTLSFASSAVSGSALPVYLRPVNNAVSFSNGSILVTSTGADSRTITLTVNSDNALNFDGVNDIVSTASNIAPLNITGDITVETWIRLNQMPTDYVRLIGKGSPLERTYGLWLYSDGSILWQQYTTASNINNLVTNGSIIPVGKWTHIAVSRTGSNVKIYINGNEVATSNAYTGTPNSSTAPLEIGGSSSIHSLLNGMFDEVRIWNVGRTASQIAGSYLSELVGDESGLVVNYSFNQGIAGGSNTAISAIEDRTSNGISATLSNFAKTGTTSNFVAGVIPEITAAGNATTVLMGGTLALSNGLAGGVWSSSNSNIASINASTGVVTGVAAGNATMSYTICGKVVTYNLTVLAPTLTTGALKTFTSCSGCVITPQSFTVAGTNLGANVIISAPTGFEISNASAGTYSSTLTLTPSAGTLTSTNVFARLINSTTTATGGNFTVASTGATTRTVTATVNTDNALNFGGAVSINIGQPIATGSSYTMEAWVNHRPPIGFTTSSNIISSNKNVFFISIDNKLYAGVNGSYTVVTSPTTIPQNTWTHVAVTFDNATKSMILYINGNQVSTGTAASGYTLSGSEPLYIGSHSGAGSSFTPVSFFKGDIDEVRIWNTVRTASDIQNNMFKELSSSETNLKSYYSFNQGVIGSSNTSITTVRDGSSTGNNPSITSFSRTGSSNNFVAGFIPEISGNAILNKGLTTTYTNSLTGGTWSSSNTNIATVNSSTGVVTGVNPGTSSITYTICEKTVSKVVTVVVPTITTSGTLNAFSTCLGTASSAQTFTVSAQYLTANLVLTAPAGYEIATSLGGTYSSTISIAPTSGTVSARLIYVRLSTSSVNGQSGNIAITSTDAVSLNIATGNAVVTRAVVASVAISSNATNNSICSGTNVVFTATPTNGGITPTYQWKLNGANVGINSATYSTTTLATNDVITVVMSSSLISCISGTPATSNAITTTVTAVPSTPGSITGQSVVCMNSNQVYSIAAVPGATSYTWVVTGNLSAAISSTTNVINITAANTQGSGTLTVFANNACGTSVASSSLSITVNNTPAPTASFTLSANTVCLTNGAVTFTSTSTPNATTNSPIGTYSWTFGDGSTAFSANASNTYTTAGTFDPILTIEDGNQCTSSFSSRITVDPASVAGSASVANPTVCEGSSATLNLTGYTGAIQWQQSIDGINFTNITGANTAAYNTGNLTTTTYYQAEVTSGLCTAATSGVITVTVSPTPAVTLASLASINSTATSFDLTYNNPVGTPDEYSITAVGPNAMPNFVAISNFGLTASPITVSIPASIPGVYNFNLLVKNGSLGCVSSVIPFTQTISASSSTITVTGLTTYTYNGSAQGPVTNTKTGSTGAVTYSYVGTGSTTYGPSGTLPTAVGTYEVIATLAADANYSGATSAAYAFSITTASSTITVTGLTTYTYNGSAQGPVTNTKTGSTGAVTYSYVGTGSTTYGPSATLPTAVGTYEVIATLAADANYSGATSAAYAFSITTASSTITVTGLTTYTFNGSGQGPVTNTKTGSTGAVTYSYVGTGSTTYGPSATLPTSVGTYQVIATLAADANYSGATSAPYTFSITTASSAITVTGLTTYTFNGSAQGPVTNAKTGSTGAVTYSYVGTGSTTYGPSATLPTAVGTYQVIATLAADANYSGATSAPYAFTITGTANPDTDGDGVTDAQEVLDGTDPNNGCSFVAASKTLTPSTAWNALDCDSDGNPNATDPNKDAPSASNDQVTLPASGIVTINILFNDDFLPGINITITRQTAPNQGTARGTVTFNPLTGEMTYKRAPFESGLVTLGYRVSYKAGGTEVFANAVVTILSCDLQDPLADCDGDGVPNGTDSAPTDPCVYAVALQVKANVSDDWKALDCDGDGVINGTELADGTSPADGCSFKAASSTLAPSAAWLLLDCDADGILNKAEGKQDYDGDDIPNCLDTDSDGDGISDKLETTADTDKDGKSDHLDLDSDNDGILDSVENGVCSGTDILCDTDGDGIPNFRDLDSDGDQIFDLAEANGADFNQDAIADGNVDEKGIPSSANKGLSPPDTDKDSKFDPYDVDSDGDGILDFDEEFSEVADFADCDNDGIINRLDPDECEIFAPQGISPNNDNKNDRLVFKGLVFRKLPNHLSVFNRWGTLVFEMDDYDNSWSGTILPDGTYYYILDFFGRKPTISNYLAIDRTIK